MNNPANEAIGNLRVAIPSRHRRLDRQEETDMTDTIEAVIQAQPAYDRVAIRADLDATRLAFRALLDATSDERWRRKSPTTKWTEGQVLVHVTWALEQLPREVASAVRGKGMFNYPKRLADPLSSWYTRWISRNATRESIGQRYDAAMTAVLRTLDEVQETDWERGARFYGERFYTVAELFHTPADHLAQHSAGL